jgi:hypothetical protein
MIRSTSVELAEEMNADLTGVLDSAGDGSRLRYNYKNLRSLSWRLHALVLHLLQMLR